MTNPMDELLKHTKAFQSKMSEATESLENSVFVGEAGAGMVKVTVNGKRQTLSIAIDDELLKEDKSVIEELLVASVNNAYSKVEDNNLRSLADLTTNFNIKDILKNFGQ